LTRFDGSTAPLAPPEPASASTLAPDSPPAQLIALQELRGVADAAPPLALESNPLLDIKARIQVCVGEATIPVGALLRAKVNEVITLDRDVDEVVDVLLEGKVIARGQLVAVGNSFGVRLSELPLPLKP
jgi:flagellar motor switch protein FliN